MVDKSEHFESEKTSELLRMLESKFQSTDLEEIQRDLKQAEEKAATEEEKQRFKVIRQILTRIDMGKDVREVMRDAVYNETSKAYKDEDVFGGYNEDSIFSGKTEEIANEKRNEIYEILDTLDERMKGRSIEEATAMFSSLLEIVGQFCTQNTDGVIAVRTQLVKFLNAPDYNIEAKHPELRQIISLMFTPEEVIAIRMRLPDMDEADPMKPFYTMVLEQAYDVVRFNEMTGNLLLIMTEYFLEKLYQEGFREHTMVHDFVRRRNQCKNGLEIAIQELCEVEKTIEGHVNNISILSEYPRYLRALINVKIGLLKKKQAIVYIHKIKSCANEYGRARAAVAFDFNRLPTYQHAVRLRQSMILKLQQDVLKFTGENLEDQIKAVQEELNQMMGEIETSVEILDPDSPEYQDLIEKKASLQKKLELSRRRLDVIRCQQHLVEVQQAFMQDAIKRYQKNHAMYQKLEQDMETHKTKSKVPEQVIDVPKKRAPRRMVQAKDKKRGHD